MGSSPKHKKMTVGNRQFKLDKLITKLITNNLNCQLPIKSNVMSVSLIFRTVYVI